MPRSCPGFRPSAAVPAAAPSRAAVEQPLEPGVQIESPEPAAVEPFEAGVQVEPPAEPSIGTQQSAESRDAHVDAELKGRHFSGLAGVAGRALCIGAAQLQASAETPACGPACRLTRGGRQGGPCVIADTQTAHVIGRTGRRARA